MLREGCLGNLLCAASNSTLQERQGSDLKIFISWSGKRSYNIARELGQRLPYIIQAVKPFVSSGNIRKGARWSSVLAEELKETQYGIICITRQNIMSPWLNFEAGALSKMIGQSYVSPLLFDVEPSRLHGPLSQFQTTIFNEQGEDMLGLVLSINNSLPSHHQVSPDILRETFVKWWWPEVYPAIKKAADNKTDETETSYPWLNTIADLISKEKDKKWKSILVIDPNPLNDWGVLMPTVQENIKEGIKYDYVIPSDKEKEFRQYVESEFERTTMSPDSKRLLSIGCVRHDRFKSLAVTHYRVLISKDAMKVLFKLPIKTCDYWVDTEGEAVAGFLSRFEEMKEEAKCQPINSSPPVTVETR
jgi:hypothetical protein